MSVVHAIDELKLELARLLVREAEIRAKLQELVLKDALDRAPVMRRLPTYKLPRCQGHIYHAWNEHDTCTRCGVSRRVPIESVA